MYRRVGIFSQMKSAVRPAAAHAATVTIHVPGFISHLHGCLNLIIPRGAEYFNPL